MNGRELELSASSFGLHNENNRRGSHATNGVEENFWGLSFWKLKCGLFFFLWNRRKWISHGIMLRMFCSNNKNNTLSIAGADSMIANLSFLDVGGRSLSIHHSRQELIMKELNAQERAILHLVPPTLRSSFIIWPHSRSHYFSTKLIYFSMIATTP